MNSISLFTDEQWIHWDGKFNGQKVPKETHVWYINMANCYNPRQYYIPQYHPNAWKGDVLPSD